MRPFLAVGAYTTAILEGENWAAVLSGDSGGSSGDRRLRPPLWPASLRLKGLYLAIATLAAHFITTYVIIHWESMTGGVLGLLVPTPTLFA